MDVGYINRITSDLALYGSFILLILGNIGCLCNFITFSSKQMRQNSCGWNFLMSTIADFFLFNSLLPTKMASDYFGNTLILTSSLYCKMRTFIGFTLPSISLGYLVFAALDRCLATSQSTRLRSFSQIKVAHRLTCAPILLYTFTTAHQLYYYDLRSKCAPLPGNYSIFMSVYNIIWTSLVPQSIMLTFGLVTFYNMRASRRRLIVQGAQQRNQLRNRIDTHFITIVLVQVLTSSILLNTLKESRQRQSTTCSRVIALTSIELNFLFKFR
ncbi:unnamed protein product [Adineta ricciae]|uniref:G-protein coupled receptors family 1 profile domain-containing protein n=1 Tax=Adineta ricciae TaxID=249248 RepID=A0A815IUQ8_ADIRI|nr:unnamed protein product [Adineta ricciae]CAF1650394.1 unnamed protein product [Adineta ricciae]